MARERKKKHDPETREEKRHLKEASESEEEQDSSSDEEEEEQELQPAKQAKSKTTSTSKPRQSSSTGNKAPTKRSSKENQRPTVSPTATTNDQEDTISLADSQATDRSAASRRSSNNRRRSASATQQITELKTKHKNEMVTKSQKERKLEKDLAAMQERLDAAEEEKAAAEAELAAEEKERKKLVGKYRDALATVGGRKASKAMKNDGMVLQIKKATKKKLWRNVKFVGNDKQLRQAAMMVLDMLQVKDLIHKDGESTGRKADIDTRVEEWLALYSTDVRAAINDQRSYVQSEMKKIALCWLKEGKMLPTPEEFQQIAMRHVQIADDNEEDDPFKVQVFDMYLMMVSACAGSGTYGDKMRRSEPISTAQTVEGKLAVPANTEAMVLVMYENCYQKWLNMHAFKEVNKKSGDIPKYSSKRHEETKMWMGKYSDSCSGNSPYGGWGSKGIKRFNTLNREIKDLRANFSRAILVVETDAVKRFSDAYHEDRKRKQVANGRSVDEEPEDAAESVSNKKQKSEEDVVADFDVDE